MSTEPPGLSNVGCNFKEVKPNNLKTPTVGVGIALQSETWLQNDCENSSGTWNEVNSRPQWHGVEFVSDLKATYKIMSAIQKPDTIFQQVLKSTPQQDGLLLCTTMHHSANKLCCYTIALLRDPSWAVPPFSVKLVVSKAQAARSQTGKKT